MHSPGSIPMAFLGFLHSPLAEQLQCVPLWPPAVTPPHLVMLLLDLACGDA